MKKRRGQTRRKRTKDNALRVNVVNGQNGKHTSHAKDANRAARQRPVLPKLRLRQRPALKPLLPQHWRQPRVRRYRFRQRLPRHTPRAP